MHYMYDTVLYATILVHMNGMVLAETIISNKTIADNASLSYETEYSHK